MKWPTRLSLFLGLVFTSSEAARAAEIALVPVSGSGGYSLSQSGNEIIVRPGQVVTLEFRVSGWSPSLLSGYQAQIDATGFSSGTSGVLSPVSDPTPNDGIFIDLGRSDFVFGLLQVIGGVSAIGTYKVGMAVQDIGNSVLDPGVDQYGGTLLLIVPSDASGTFTVGLDSDPTASFLIDENGVKLPSVTVTLTPALITIQTGNTIFVDADATGTGSGFSWQDAFTSLPDALADAAMFGGPGTEIWVAEGIYMPDGGYTPPGGSHVPGSGDSSTTFQLLNGVGLFGGFAGGDSVMFPGGETMLSQRDIVANVATLSGDLLGNDIPAEFPNGASFADNSFHVVTANGIDATTALDGFTITGGHADGAFPDNRGGGMLNSATSMTVAGCTFTRNFGTIGGAMNNSSSNLTISGCSFIRNASGNGGGILNDFGSSPSLTNCVFLENVSTGPGGGMNSLSDNPVLTNCTFIRNEAGTSGGGILIGAGAPVLTNCTFSENISQTGGGLLNTGSPVIIISNCIFWGNSDAGGMDESAQIDDPFAGVVVNHTLVQGLTGSLGGVGNVGGDPLFFDPVGGDLRVSAGSPAIDAGDTTALPADVADLDDDGDTTEPIPIDLAGNPRVRDDGLTVDTGVPVGGLVVDMGAFELILDCNNNGFLDECDVSCAGAGGACATVPGCGLSSDCNGNGIPDACDIAGCMDGDVTCDDCNLNGVPDLCDVPPPAGNCSVGCSVDTTQDGVPDECVQTTGTGATNNWSDPTNWELGGNTGDFPDDTAGVPDLSVTLDVMENLTVDVDVMIDVFRMLEFSTLNQTGVGAGDFTTLQPGGILTRGMIFVANDRKMLAQNGPFVADNGGFYGAAFNAGANGCDCGANPCGPGDTCAVLEGDDVIIRGGGEIDLSGGMTLIAHGDLILEGVPPSPLFALPAVAIPLGITPPPKLGSCRQAEAGCKTNIVSERNIRLKQATDSVATQGATVSFALDFINESIMPSLFDWREILLTTNGSSEQRFEVGGIDLEADSKDFVLNDYITTADALFDTLDAANAVPHTNYTIGTLQIGTETVVGNTTVPQPATVRFNNLFANTVGLNPLDEALYVKTLVLVEGSRIIAEDVRLYIHCLNDRGGQIDLVGSGELVYLPTVQPPLAATSIQNIRILSLTPTNAGLSTAIQVKAVNLPPPDDVLNGTAMWVGPPVEICENSGQTTPPPEGCGVAPGQPRDRLWMARLQCDPFFTDWTAFDQVNVYDELLVPSAEYEVRTIVEGCSVDIPNQFSVPLTLSTSPWGDLIGDPCTPGLCSPPNGIIGITTDVTAVLDKFSNLDTAPSKIRTDIDPNLLDLKIGIADVTQTLDAFSSKPYPFAAATECSPP